MSPHVDPRLLDDDEVLLALLQRLDEPPCLPSHLLEGYIADTLSTREAEHVHAHLRQCIVCVGALARLHSMHADEPAPAPVAAPSTDPASALFPALGLIGRSPAFNAVQAQLERLLQGSSGGRGLPPVLIEGETGTGKTHLAAVIHQTGPRADGPFVHVNCAGIPEALLEAQIFGFERGAFERWAFTDARRPQPGPGLLHKAHRGTIFLDEVGLLSEGLQAKLLKVLEERTVRRLGSTRDEPIDVWILTATSEDLKTGILGRRFREDLYHRLAVLTLSLPPLRERGDDILLLAEHFLERACREAGVPPRRLDAEARGALLAYDWPGNVRELEYLMAQVVLVAETEVITARNLAIDRATETRPLQLVEYAALLPPGAGKPQASDITDAERLAAALESAAGNLSRAAALLGVPRNTLRHRLKKLGLLPRKG